MVEARATAQAEIASRDFICRQIGLSAVFNLTQDKFPEEKVFTASWIGEYEVQHTRHDGLIWFGSGYEVAYKKFKDDPLSPDNLFVFIARDKAADASKSVVIVAEVDGNDFRQAQFRQPTPAGPIYGTWKDGKRGMRSSIDSEMERELTISEEFALRVATMFVDFEVPYRYLLIPTLAERMKQLPNLCAKNSHTPIDGSLSSE